MLGAIKIVEIAELDIICHVCGDKCHIRCIMKLKSVAHVEHDLRFECLLRCMLWEIDNFAIFTGGKNQIYLYTFAPFKNSYITAGEFLI
jgi:hypothetical protein